MVSNEKGMVFPLVIMITAVLMALCMSLYLFSRADMKHISLEDKKMQAYYLARSGAELVARCVDIDAYTVGGIPILVGESDALRSDSITFDPDGSDVEDYTQKIKIKKVYRNSDNVIIVSKGKVSTILFDEVSGRFEDGGSVTQTVELELKRDGSRKWREYND